MRNAMRFDWFVAVAVGVAMLVPGCAAEKTERSQPSGPTVADGLANLRDLFTQAAAGKTTLPKSVGEFAAVEPFYPVAGPFVLSGGISCAWGASLKQGSDAAARLLAWETTAAKDGGWAMFQDGTIRRLTADEFKAAAKATP